MSDRLGRPWSDAEKQRLRGLSGADRATLREAFPDRSPAAVYVAIKRCKRRPDDGRPPTAIDRAAVRARFQRLSIEAIYDALPELLERSAAFKGTT